MEDKQKSLDSKYLRMARIWAENSYCKRRQVGALVVKDHMIISDGYNGTPSGFDNVCEEHNISFPYVLIIQSGIKRVVYAETYRLDDGLKLLKRANIETVLLEVQ